MIFYLDGTGQHGLIAATNNQSSSATWGCYGTALSGADGTATGTGLQNTNDIINGCYETGIAAKICSDLSLGGYNDWYLPSKDESYLIFQNRNAIGGFSTEWCYYWTSSEAGAYNAWSIRFPDGFQNSGSATGTYKSDNNSVRCIRSF